MKTPLAPYAYHLVVRARFPLKPFDDRTFCQKTWRRLQNTFPACLAAVLMPNHLHLILAGDAGSPDSLQKSLQKIFRGTSWERVPAAQAILDRTHLERQVRYVHLNPCRQGLTSDPLAWEWSTHREYMNSIRRPWAQEAKLTFRKISSTGLKQARSEFHRYVSADPSVHPLGTPAPKMPQAPVIIDLYAAEKAAELVCRAEAGAFRRKGVLRARLMGLLAGPLHVPKAAIARHFGVHATSVRVEACDGVRDPMLAPLLMTLGDERLLNPVSMDSSKTRNQE